MKKLASAILLLSICGSTLPISAQSKTSKSVKAVKQLATSDVFVFAKAFSDGSSSWVTWDVDLKSRAMAFEVSRLTSQGPELLTVSPIPGAQMSKGFFDIEGVFGTVYQISAILPDGKRVTSEPVSSEYIEDIETVAGRANAELSAVSDNNGIITSQRLELPREFLETAKQARAYDPAMQRMLSAQAGVKIGIKRDGMYRIKRDQLQAAGFDVNSDPTKWQLFLNGVERAINVDAAGNYIEFFGRGIETIECDIAQYYLIVGSVNGKRMTRRVSRPINGPVIAKNYDQTFTYRERIGYVWDFLNGEAENWWGSIFYDAGINIPLTITGVDPESTVTKVNIALHGYSIGQHNVPIELNGHSLGTLTWSGSTPHTAEFTIPTSHLLEGANTLSLRTLAGNDFVMFDTIDFRYARKFAANLNRVQFYTLGTRGAVVSGFSTSNIRLFDITNETEPGIVDGLTVTSNAGAFDLQLPAYRTRVYSALDDSAMLTPFSIKANNASSLATPANNGTLTIISHPDLMVEAENWAAYRRGQGTQVRVVDVEDIYDEFSYGLTNAASVTAFLNYARLNWQTPPQYVLLLGDGSYDPKNYTNRGYQNMVPTKMVSTVYLETGSDEALADFDNDGLSEIAIGRIPVSTPSQAAAQLARVVAFETPSQQNLDRGAVFAYDAPNGFDFQWMSQQLRGQLPSSMPVVYVDRLAANSQQTLINEINTGKYLANYAGHGTTGSWFGTSFFSVNNLNGAAGFPQVANGSNKTIFTMLTCLNGYFINPYADSLSEWLIKHNNGGASLAWASTGLTTPDIQMIMATRFFSQLGGGAIPRSGDLVKDAKTTIPGGTDVRLSWALIGDPMLKVR